MDPFEHLALFADDRPHEKPRITQAVLRPFCASLRAYRKKNGVTQQQMATALKMSRKTYVFFESARWLPPPREVGQLVKRLHDHDPAVAQAFLRVRGERLEDHAIVQKPATPAGGAPLDAAQAKLVFDAAVYATAEDLDMSPKAVRPIAAALLGKLAGTGVTLAQAAELAKGAGKKPA